MGVLLICLCLFSLADLFPLVRRRSWRAVVVFSLLFLSALTLSVLYQLNIEVPSAMKLVGDLVKALHLSY